MKSIIPEESQSTIFDKLIQAAMDDFISEGEVLVSFAAIIWVVTQQRHATRNVVWRCCVTTKLTAAKETRELLVSISIKRLGHLLISQG